MREYTFTTEQWIPAPLDDVFAFFSDVENLLRIEPEALRVRVEAKDLVATSITDVHPPLTVQRHFIGHDKSLRVWLIGKNADAAIRRNPLDIAAAGIVVTDKALLRGGRECDRFRARNHWRLHIVSGDDPRNLVAYEIGGTQTQVAEIDHR